MGDKRRVDAGLVLICQTNMGYDGAAALGHANGLGGAHPPISGFGCLREQLGGKDGALAAHTGNHDVEH